MVAKVRVLSMEPSANTILLNRTSAAKRKAVRAGLTEFLQQLSSQKLEI